MGDDGMRRLLRRIVNDVRVEVTEEVDNNFARQGFFNESWKRRMSPIKPGRAVLMDSGALRRSVASEVSDDSVRFSSDLVYAAIHNEGGEIKVTERMKRFFWAQYYRAAGNIKFRRDGSRRQTKGNRQLGTEAEFWKRMALMRVGKTVKMPKRQFLGYHPMLDERVMRIIERDLGKYFDNDFTLVKDSDNVKKL